MGTELNYRIEEKKEFTAVGIMRHFSQTDCYEKIPVFWQEVMGMEDGPMGMFGVCFNFSPGGFDYIIGDLYQPWKAIPEGWEAFSIPAGRWAVFPAIGKLPDALQAVNTRVWSEWIPAHPEYEMSGNYSIEMYFPPAEDPEKTLSEIWLPL